MPKKFPLNLNGTATAQPSTNQESRMADQIEVLPDNAVLIAGGGPVGLLLSTVLAHHGVKSVLLERNKTTTKWPKMDLTNARSMEIFRRLGLADGLRKQGVPSHFPYTVLISSGLSREKPITSWQHPSVDECREKIREQNDGTQPLEPYQRISQAVFEAWLKGLSDENPLIDLRFGWKVESVVEEGDKVKTTAVHIDTGKQQSFISNYVGACDGAGSKLRTGLGIPLDGGPVPGYVLLIHFKSKDLSKIQKQGQFWHIFMLREGQMSGAVIAQDEVDTWTVHLFLPLEAEHETINSYDAVYSVLGGMGEKYEIKIDEILVRSTYRPNVAVSRNYSSLNGRVLFAGDSAHQNIPTGGYGMNMGIADAYDLGWKLAAVVNGYCGRELLNSYEEDRRPVAFMSVEHSKNHMAVHGGLGELLQPNAKAIDDDSDEGREMRRKVHDHYQNNDGENKDLGIEMGFRYHSKVNIPDGTEEPSWTPKKYIPSTFPGARAPHIFLRDGTAIFDLYGKDFTLIEFTDGIDRGGKLLAEAAQNKSMPLKHVILKGEDHAAKIWEKRLVLVRPDGHVAWRSDFLLDRTSARTIIETVTGNVLPKSAGGDDTVGREAFAVSGTGVVTTQKECFALERMGDIQK